VLNAYSFGGINNVLPVLGFVITGLCLIQFRDAKVQAPKVSNTKDAMRALECFLERLDVFKISGDNFSSDSFKFLSSLPTHVTGDGTDCEGSIGDDGTNDTTSLRASASKHSNDLLVARHVILSYEMCGSSGQTSEDFRAQGGL